MPPKPDEEHVNSNEDGELQLSFKDRATNGLKNFMFSLRLFIFNKENRTFFGNSTSFWIKISIYYFFFYLCLALFYCGMVAVFGAIVSREEPTYWYHNNAMNDGGKFYIGMGFRPMPVIDDTSLTIYSDLESQNKTISSLTTYRKAFLTQYDPANLEDCSPTEPASKLQGSHSCKFAWADIVASDTHPCSETYRYGWATGKPCVLVKLNKIYGWVPGGGNVTNQVVNATKQPILPVDQREQNIFITCNGKDAADVEVLGPMLYYSLLHPLGNPNYGGIPFYFYPYKNSKDHVEPFVLVQFLLLPLDRLVLVECRAWASNIQQLSEGTTSRGMVTFSLYKSNKTAPVKS